MRWFEQYGKSLALVGGAIAVVVTTALTDDVITNAEKIMIAIAVVNAIVVYIIPNLTGGVALWAKGITSAALAVLTGLTGWMLGGMQPADWWALLMAAATAAGVLVLPSAKHQSTPVVADPTRPGGGTGA